MASRYRAALGLAAACALAFPVAASADDQSIYNDFHTSHPRFKQLRRDFEKGERHWEDSNFQDPSDAYSACRKTAALAQKVSDRIRPKTSSSTKGKQARDDVMSALNHRRLWADHERHAIEAFMRTDGDTYLRLHHQAKKDIATAQHYEKEAQTLFEQAGVNTNP
jgi:hypothetical protein